MNNWLHLSAHDHSFEPLDSLIGHDCILDAPGSPDQLPSNEPQPVEGSDVDNVDSDGSEGQELRNKRRLQTEKARMAALRNRLKVKEQKLQDLHNEGNPTEPQGLCGYVLQTCFAAGKPMRTTPSNRMYKKRGVLALLRAFAKELQRFLGLVPQECSHVMSFNVMDDCSIRLGDRYSPTSSIHCICNNYQRLILSDHGHSNCTFSFRLHQPMLVLENATAQILHSNWASWLAISANKLGYRLQQLGLDSSVLKAKIRCQILTTDALKTNRAVFSIEFARYQENRLLGWVCKLVC